MPHIRTTAVLLFFIVLNYKTAFLQKCNICVERNFDKIQACTCPEDQFCLTDNKQCQKCNDCYHFWKNNTEQRRSDIENILQEIVKRYEVDLNELQKLLQIWVKALKRTESEFTKLNRLSAQAQLRITTVQENLTKLQNDIEKVRELLKKIKKPQSIEELLKNLKKIKQFVRSIVDELKLLKFDTDVVDLQQIDKLTKIRKGLDEMLKEFPDIEKNSLNLALSLESDIDLLEPIIFGNNSTAQFPQKLNESTRWIEQELLWLFDLINNYQNVSIDVGGLFKNASRIRSSAGENDESLENLIKKHEEFKKELDQLKDEVQFYNETVEAYRRVQSLSKEIEQFKRLKRILKKKEELLRELKAFDTERNQLKKIIKQIQPHETQLNQLFDEQDKLLEKLGALVNIKPVAEIIEDIEKMTREAEAIREELFRHCSSTTKSQ